MKLAVLGDSDSHSYADRITFPAGTDRRGGPFRDATLQWTEALARLRPGDLDPGPWGEQGTRRAVALARWAAGRPFRTPRREEFAHNFSLSGAVCADLVSRPFGQARQLRSLVAADPAAWEGAVVVIRIGINDLGTPEQLERFAEGGPDEAHLAKADACAESVGQALALLDGAGARLRVVLVGILDNTDWPRLHGRWRDRESLARIRAVLDRYDAALKRLAAGGRDRAFFDDRAWFATLWGRRDADGMPAYRAVDAGGVLTVRLAEGDDPANAVLADGHAGLAWNVLWARSLHDLVRETWNPGLAPVADAEVAGLLRAMTGRRAVSAPSP